MFTAFLALPSLPRSKRPIRHRAAVTMTRPTSSILPRIVVLPGLDGTDLLLDPFRKQLCASDDPNRVIAVDYPHDRILSVQEMASFVHDNYLTQLEHDKRGYVVVNQSFSGHVGFHLARRKLPGLLQGQVFINSFVSPPGPAFLQSIPLGATTPFFKNLPPGWMVSRFFLGPNAEGMDRVQSQASRVQPEVMTHRLSLCLKENSWDLWRNRNVLLPSRTLYLRGDDDFLISRREAQQLRSARPDIFWVSIRNGPHMLLQRYGTECAVAIDEFCTSLHKRYSSFEPFASGAAFSEKGEGISLDTRSR